MSFLPAAKPCRSISRLSSSSPSPPPSAILKKSEYDSDWVTDVKAQFLKLRFLIVQFLKVQFPKAQFLRVQFFKAQFLHSC